VRNDERGYPGSAHWAVCQAPRPRSGWDSLYRS
jgi:hypothetical protein